MSSSEVRKYTIFYTNLSAYFPSDRNIGLINTMHEIETCPAKEEEYADIAERGGSEKAEPFLNKYELSPRDFDNKQSKFYKDNGKILNIFRDSKIVPVYGTQTNEPTIKSVLQTSTIDELIIIASETVYSGSIARYSNGKNESIQLSDALDKLKNIESIELEDISNYDLYDDNGQILCRNQTDKWRNTLDYFIMEIRHYLEDVLFPETAACDHIKKISIYPTRDDVKRGDMTNLAINIAQKMIDAKKMIDAEENHAELQIVLDSNGGKRDMAIIQIAILRALNANGIEADNILYSNFNKKEVKWGDHPVEIQDKKHEYEIFDVVSGLDEYREYGRVDKLQDYFEDSNSGIVDVLLSIQSMCEVFMTCFTEDMIDSLIAVKKEVLNYPKEGYKDGRRENQEEQYRLADFVVEQIKMDMDEVFSSLGKIIDPEAVKPEVHADGRIKVILPLIEWCSKKKLYQQAVTLYVDRIDEWYYTSNLLRRPGPNDEKEFYKYLYMPDQFEQKYIEVVNTIWNGNRPSYPFEKTRYLQVLEDLKQQPGLRVNVSKVDGIKNRINSVYDSDGNKIIGTPNSRKMPGNIEGYHLKDILQNVDQLVDNTVVKAQKGTEENKIRQYICERTKFPQRNKNLIIQQLQNSFSQTDNGLDIDPGRLTQMIANIQGGYDQYGYLDKNFQMQGPLFESETLYGLMNDELNKKYTELSVEYMNRKSLIDSAANSGLSQGNRGQSGQGNAGEKSLEETYINKMIAIKHQNLQFAANIVIGGMNDEDKYEMLQAIMKFYLAFKIVRNNSNHSNGQGNVFTRETCLWLKDQKWNGMNKEGPIIPFNNSQFTGNVVRLNFISIKKMLENALEFNKDFADRVHVLVQETRNLMDHQCGSAEKSDCV